MDRMGPVGQISCRSAGRVPLHRRVGLLALLVCCIPTRSPAQTGERAADSPAGRGDTVVLRPCRDSLQTPVVAAEAFYRWYLRHLAAGTEPRDQRETLHTVVTTRRLAALDRAEAGPDVPPGDYFLTTQDWLRSWPDAIRGVLVRRDPRTATVQMLIGPWGNEQLRLRVGLLCAGDGIWRIDTVRRVETPQTP